MRLRSFRRSAVAACAMLAISLGGLPNAIAGTLSLPLGITVDGSGNVYVGNANVNTVTVYDKNYNLIRTLNTQISSPVSLAYDKSADTLLVGNESAQGVTYFDRGQTYDPTLSIADPAFAKDPPTAVAVDGIGDRWVLTVAGTVSCYPLGFNVSAPSRTGSFPGATAVAFGGDFGAALGARASATTTAVQRTIISSAVGGLPGFSAYGTLPVAQVGGAAADAKRNIYLTDRQNKTVVLTDLVVNPGTVIINVGDTPFGIALDTANQRIYVSAPVSNRVYVYKLIAPYTLLHVIT